MSDSIRAALERLIKDTEYLVKGGEDLDCAWAAIAAARAAWPGNHRSGRTTRRPSESADVCHHGDRYCFAEEKFADGPDRINAAERINQADIR